MCGGLPGPGARQTSRVRGLPLPKQRQAVGVSPTRAAAAAAVFVATAGLFSGCSESGSKVDLASSGSRAPLPENLCAPVLAAVSADWQLSEDAHGTEDPTAVCELTGPGDTSLRVTLTDFPDPDAAAAALD